jgi:hypothetical protein
MDRRQFIGSQTAKNGFLNERDIVVKFNNWQNDAEAEKWLILMNYNLSDIEKVEAFVLKGYKADINVQVKIYLKDEIDVQNIQVKLVSQNKGFNQVDKRKVDNYNKVLHWNIPDEIMDILKRFTGEIIPNIPNPKDPRRMFMNEFTELEQNKLLDFLKKNKTMILIDILRGRGEFSAEWVIVAQKKQKNARWILKNINEVINHYDGDVVISPRGSVSIGRVLMQRKGGTPDPTSLQFKIDPTELFDI